MEQCHLIQVQMNIDNRTPREHRPCFAVDIDNVLARAEPEVQRTYTELTNKPWPQGMYGSAGGLDTDQLPKDVVEEIFVRFHEHAIPCLPLLPSARMALTQLQHRYRIAIITARRPTSRFLTLQWLRAHRVPFEELYHTEEKAEVPEDICLAVDDHPLHALAYCKRGVRVFLMDQPWNKGVSHSLLTRVTGWDDLLQVLDYGNIQSPPANVVETPPVKSLLQLPNHHVASSAVEV